MKEGLDSGVKDLPSTYREKKVSWLNGCSSVGKVA